MDYLSTENSNKGKKSIFFLESSRLLSKISKKTKGLLRVPCLFMVVIAIFLFVFVSGSSGLAAKYLSDKSDFPLSGIFLLAGFEDLKKENLFFGTAQGFLSEPPSFILVENSGLKASSPPTTFSSQVLGVLVAGYEPEEEKRPAIIEHIVESGDTLSSLAVEYDVSLDTIRWANNLTEKSTIKLGDNLVILPVSGTVHHVKSGDTVSEIAKTYKGKTEEIIAFNQLLKEDDIYIGDIIIVPKGVIPAPIVQQQQAPAVAPLASSYFIIPVSSPYIITQRLHWYNAIDFSHQGNACGKPVFAAAGGTIQRTGYDRTAGNYVRVLHPNGVITFYGHLSKILVSSGQTVSQGTPIGYIGNTGYTIGVTGCHLHFEVRGAKNPFAR